MPQFLKFSILVGLLGVMSGCGDSGLPVAPAEGRVTYLGKPLEFGSVMFQPRIGPPARGVIQPDGTFSLSTYESNDGAIVGMHKVRIACFESQRPGTRPAGSVDEPGVGRSLIPAKYANFDTSGWEVEVVADNEPFVFELVD